MKRAIGLIAATLVTASVYSQDSSSSSPNPDSTPADYQSRQSEAGAPATSDSSSSSTTGYETTPGASGGNSLTGQSSGANLGSSADQDETLTTRDSEVSGSEYRGSAESAETSSNSNSESDIEGTGQIRGSGSSDGAFHEPAVPVREGAESEGWSGSGTFSGAGPGAVSGPTSTKVTPPVSEGSTGFETEESGNAALEERDDDLSSRGLEPDSNALSHDDTFLDRAGRDINDDGTIVFEDWTIVEPDTNVGGPAGSDSGSSSSSASSNGSDDSYNRDLHMRVQRDWSSRYGNTDVPATLGVEPMTPRVMDHEFDHLRVYSTNPADSTAVGAPSGNESGAAKSSDKECEDDTKKNKGSSAESESNEVNSDSDSTSAPGEYGDRATRENYDDGHLNGNNAAGNSSASESSPASEQGALTQPDL